MVCGSFRLHPLVGMPFVNRLERETDRRWREAKRAGSDDTRDALAADAFAEMVAAAAHPTSTASNEQKGRRARRPSVNADVVIVQSAEVARRGHAHPGELCHIVGGGPVAPAAVEELIAAGAFVKAVLHDGEQVTTSRTTAGTSPPRCAPHAGSVRRPTFDGRRCAEDGCERRLGLETDHLDPVANGGATSLENLGDKCWQHHQEKTKRDRAAGRLRRGP